MSSQCQTMANQSQMMAMKFSKLRHQLIPNSCLSKPDESVDLELSFSSEPIEGWRLWRVGEFFRRGNVKEHRLYPVGGGTQPWEPLMLNRSRCNRHPHEAPWASCGCGFWGFRTMEGAKSAIYDYNVHALGIIHMAGRVLECEQGWRAQLAYPQGLVFFNIEKEIAESVATLYGVPYEMAGQPMVAPGTPVEVTPLPGRYSYYPLQHQRDPDSRIHVKYSCGHQMVHWLKDFQSLTHKMCPECLRLQEPPEKSP